MMLGHGVLARRLGRFFFGAAILSAVFRFQQQQQQQRHQQQPSAPQQKAVQQVQLRHQVDHQEVYHDNNNNNSSSSSSRSVVSHGSGGDSDELDREDPRFQWPPSKEILNSVAIENKLVITHTNCGYLHMLENWLMSVRRQGVENVLVIASDRFVFEAMERYWPGHVIWPQFFQEIPMYAFQLGSKNYNKMMASRPTLLRTFLDLNYTVLNCDVDSVWKGNALQIVQETDVELAVASDSHPTYRPEDLEKDQKSLCAGLLWLKPTDLMKDMMVSWANAIEASNRTGNQPAFNEVFPHYEHRLRWRLLDKEQFPPGFITFRTMHYNWLYRDEWHPTREPIIVHANWMGVTARKVAALQSAGLWDAKGEMLPCESVVSLLRSGDLSLCDWFFSWRHNLLYFLRDLLSWLFIATIFFYGARRCFHKRQHSKRRTPAIRHRWTSTEHQEHHQQQQESKFQDDPLRAEVATPLPFPHHPSLTTRAPHQHRLDIFSAPPSPQDQSSTTESEFFERKHYWTRGGGTETIVLIYRFFSNTNNNNNNNRQQQRHTDH